MREINVGIIGTGFIGPAHIEALRRLGNINIAALADIDIDTAKVKAENLNIKKYYGDYKELLKDDSIEVVHICTPNHLHYQMAKDALEADRHVICEKPLAIKIEEALELVELAEKKKKINAVHFNVRYYPLMRQVKMMVQKGDIGRIFSIHGSYLQD
ncbi:MAG TPA: Gfo/Idh/MocA family oxidoreductase, partial [candidate division WOR-3 bacterium]|nr:Gfo/Idh/MocA family oxidoreductase [candidate division WOR-3 bacterium]